MNAELLERISQQTRQRQGNQCAACRLPHLAAVQRLKSDKRQWRVYEHESVMWSSAQIGYLVLCWRDGDKRNLDSANLLALCSVCSQAQLEVGE